MAETRPGLDDFEEFCSELVLEDGGRMTLHDFQKVTLRPFFDGTRETVILEPKKQGKSTLLAALADFHLVTTPDADCRIIATSRDQARLIYDAARGFVRRTPALNELVVIRRGSYELRNADDDGVIRVMAADVDTLDGIRPTLALIDEQARAKSSEAYAICRDGLGPRNGRMVCISTAGDDETSVLGELRRQAYTLPGFKRDPKNRMHRFVETPRFAFHEWALDPTDERSYLPDDPESHKLRVLENLKLANPAPWQTIEALRSRHDSPSMRPWELARFMAGVWQVGEDAAISDIEWRRCADPETTIPDGTAGVHIGLDLAYKQHTTAFTPTYLHGGIVIVGKPVILHRSEDGTPIQVEDIIAVAHDFDRRYPEATFVIDPEIGGDLLAQRLEKELDGTISEHSQKWGPMSRAAERLVTAIADRKLRHPDDPELTSHVLSAQAKSVGEGFRFERPPTKGRHIDALIALAMAVDVLLAPPGPSRELRQTPMRELPEDFILMKPGLTLRGERYIDRDSDEMVETSPEFLRGRPT